MVRGIPQQRPNIISTIPGSATPLTVVSSTPPNAGLSTSPTNIPSHLNKVIVIFNYYICTSHCLKFLLIL